MGKRLSRPIAAYLRLHSLDFKLYLAIPANLYDNKFQTPLAQLMIQKNQVNLLVFDPIQEVIERWINSNATEA
ncbi:element excision factor XisH family protein [Microcoleus sp. Pol7_A1]|uniref:element excision factor XisH family protein n=1 Tax=Microcoleus sp. Pol7_A1 TaxID=2818893 RepID=UPI002FD4B5A8